MRQNIIKFYTLFGIFIISKEKPLNLCITDCPRLKVITQATKWRGNKNNLWRHSLLVIVVWWYCMRQNNLFGIFIISKEKPLDLCITDLRDPCSPYLKLITQAKSKRSGERIKTTCGDTPWWSL
jgi:hypothetical protein